MIFSVSYLWNLFGSFAEPFVYRLLIRLVFVVTVGAAAACVRCARADDQSRRYLYGEEAGQTTSSHHAHHGLRAHPVPEEARPDRSGPRETVSQAILGGIAQGRHHHVYTASSINTTFAFAPCAYLMSGFYPRLRRDYTLLTVLVHLFLCELKVKVKVRTLVIAPLRHLATEKARRPNVLVL